jgi:hypothetical protein
LKAWVTNRVACASPASTSFQLFDSRTLDPKTKRDAGPGP